MRVSTRTALFGAALLMAAGALPASPRPEKAEKDAGGVQFLHGTIVAESGKRYTGVLRWGGEEAFWDDMFNATKSELPYASRQPASERPRSTFRILGFLPIGYTEKGEKDRQFAARFGDIKEIHMLGEDSVEVTMKSGETYRLEGGSNDVGAIVHVDDPDTGGIDLNWSAIKRITLEPVPERASERKAWRLFGDVATDKGNFKGFIQWDSQECLSVDQLDGDFKHRRISLEMGQIRAIEKSGDHVRVETKDGRTLDMYGTNDVDDSIRGILVEDERYGRVKVSWSAFKRVDFRQPSPPGHGYDAYVSAGPIKGSVTDRNGKKWKGRIVFDLDESQSWEMLDGERDGVEYSVPFDRIRTLEPVGDLATMVTLRNGQKLKLEQTQDVNDKNAGIVVMQTEGPESERYVSWKNVTRIDLD